MSEISISRRHSTKEFPIYTRARCPERKALYQLFCSGIHIGWDDVRLSSNRFLRSFQYPVLHLERRQGDFRRSRTRNLMSAHDSTSRLSLIHSGKSKRGAKGGFAETMRFTVLCRCRRCEDQNGIRYSKHWVSGGLCLAERRLTVWPHLTRELERLFTCGLATSACSRSPARRPA